MDRIVFCQSEEFINDAVKIAEEWRLPIQVGDSDRTKNLDFDRTQISVIQIPIHNGFGPFPSVIMPLKSIVLEYFNDYIDCSSLEFFLSTENSMMTKTVKMEIFMNDIHHISVPIYIDLIGYYAVSVHDENGQLAKVHFGVSNGEMGDITAYD